MSASSQAPDLRAAARAARRTGLWVVLAALVGTGLVALVREALRSPPTAPGPLIELRGLRLVDQDGAPFTEASFAGRAWVVSFFFTSCPSLCPKLMGRVSGLVGRTAAEGDGLRFLSISVDPATDTPERLRANAAKYGADLRRWTFLTGPFADVERAVREGFRESMDREGTKSRNAAGEEVYDIAHSGRLVLVDGRGRIRGYYDTDEAGTAALLRDAALVMKEGR